MNARTEVVAEPTARELEEGFLYFALSCARTARENMERLEAKLQRGTRDWHMEADNYTAALDDARRHAAVMREKGWPFDEILEQMLRWEGIA